MSRLRRSDLNRPGITRIRRGKGFSYRWPNGQTVSDEEVLDRIKSLAVPPAWEDVWISPWPHGHIQATGTDNAGRRQYLYHPAWRRRRDSDKYDRAVEFGRTLPAVRRRVRTDLALDGLPLRRVAAAAVRLLDIGCFRVGGDQYARDHETFGLATLRRDHVTFRGGQMEFTFPAKGSVTQSMSIDDPAVAAVLRPLKLRRTGPDRLFAWKGDSGWVEMNSNDVNAYLKEAAGDQFSAKDFRTWSGTVYAALTLAAIESPGRSGRSRRRVVTDSVKEVAEYLGNTPAVCRSSYIDPRVIDKFEAGETIRQFAPELFSRGSPSGERLRFKAERAVISLLERSE